LPVCQDFALLIICLPFFPVLELYSNTFFVQYFFSQFRVKIHIVDITGNVRVGGDGYSGKLLSHLIRSLNC